MVLALFHVDHCGGIPLVYIGAEPMRFRAQVVQENKPVLDSGIKVSFDCNSVS